MLIIITQQHIYIYVCEYTYITKKKNT